MQCEIGTMREPRVVLFFLGLQNGQIDKKEEKTKAPTNVWKIR